MVNILFKKVAKKSKLCRRQSTDISSHLANLWEGIIAFLYSPPPPPKNFQSRSPRATLRPPPNRNRISLIMKYELENKLAISGR